MIINCIALDDEPLALELLEDYIRKVPYLNLVRCFNNPVDTLDFLKENPVDLLLLDILMEELSGIQLVQILKNKPNIIFTTAYDKFALQGYELDIVDYLLKPISFDRFIKAVDKVYERISNSAVTSSNSSLDIQQTNQNTNGNHWEGPQEDYFFVKTEFKHQKVNFNDVLFVEGMGDYQCIYTTKEKIMTLMNFKKLVDILPEIQFTRVHKSYIVSLNKINIIEKNRVKIGEKLIPIGESYKIQFFDLLKKRHLISEQ